MVFIVQDQVTLLAGFLVRVMDENSGAQTEGSQCEPASREAASTHVSVYVVSPYKAAMIQSSGPTHTT